MKVSWLDYVGLVRGINVGVGNRVSMADFRGVFESLGFTDVKTLLQSGNVVFRSNRHLGPPDVDTIERAFEAVAGFPAGFVVLSSEQFAEVLDANPLLDISTDPSRSIVTFLPQVPDARPAPMRAKHPAAPDVAPAALQLPDAQQILPEVFATGLHAVYSWHPEGISKSRVPSAFWKQLGPVYTARNLNTTGKLADLLDARREA